VSDAHLAFVCYLVAALSAVGLVALRHPDTFLSRLVDRPADENTTEGNPS
jgi:hypothetical protein